MMFQRDKQRPWWTPLLAGLAALVGFAAQSQTQFTPGFVKVEMYTGIGGTAIANLTGNAKYPDNPDEVRFVKFLEFPNGDDDGNPPPGNVFDNYGIRVSGYIIPKETASYIFFLAADDEADFWLSTDSSPSNARRIAHEPQWNPVRAWATLDRRDATNPQNRSDTFQASQWPGGPGPIQLQANQRYYFYGRMKEGGGGDNWAVTWIKAGEADPENGALPIGGEFIGVDAPTTVSFIQHPQSTTVFAGRSVELSVRVSAVPNLTIHWFRNGTAIPDATGPVLRDGPLTLAQNGTRYRAEARVNGVTVATSDEATVTVVNPPPEVDTPGMLKFEYFANILPRAEWTGVDQFPNWPAYIANDPHQILYMTAFNSRTVFPDDSHEDYGARITGWITPIETGDYHFFLRSDDPGQLWLSTDASAANLQMIAEETGCCDAFKEPDAENNQGETTFSPIRLVAGQRYYVMALLREYGGGDYIQVAWRREGDTTPAANLQPIPSAFLSTRAIPAGSVTITSNPQDATAPASGTAQFTVGVETTGTPVVIQWQKNGVNIPGANGLTYTTPPLRPTDNGATYRAVVSVPGVSATSAAATLTVTADTTNPSITRVSGSETFDTVTVHYSEEMGAGVDAAAAYNIPGLTISGATRIQNIPTIVRLTTSAQQVGQQYTVTVTGGQDMSGNPLTPNSFTFSSYVLQPGVVNYERYNTTEPYETFRESIVGQRPPDFSGVLSSFRSPVNVADNYGGRIRGFFTPATSGSYVFFMSSDDRGGLYLSTDADPANIKQIAFEPTWNGDAQWLVLDRRNPDAPENRSDTWTDTQWPSGNTINLTAGTRYYLEVLWKEGGGGDNGAATFKLAGEADPANGSASRLSGNLISWYVDPFTLPAQITTQPGGGGVYSSGDALTFTAPVVTGGAQPYSYQWERNRIAIPGATSADLNIPNAGVAHVGDYRLRVTTAAGIVTYTSEVRAIMRGAFLVEAEDFNYDNGKSKPEASVMPYLGGAYAGLDAVLGVDYNNNDGRDSNSYRDGPLFTAGQNVNQNGNDGDRLRGDWSVTSNYKIGWVSDGEWQNYTRNFPAGQYNVYAALSHGNQGATDLRGSLATVAGDTTTATQTPTVVGTFTGVGTGGWGSNDLIPMMQDGAMASVNLSGTQTVRFNLGSGDFDYLLFYPVSAGPIDPPVITSITRSGASVTVTWTGGGTLWVADSITGPWTDTGLSSPVTAPIDRTQRYGQVRR